MQRADTDSNAVIDLAEFVKYMHAHERKLHLAFTSLDRNRDGEQRIMWCFFLQCIFFLLFYIIVTYFDGFCLDYQDSL